MGLGIHFFGPNHFIIIIIIDFVIILFAFIFNVCGQQYFLFHYHTSLVGFCFNSNTFRIDACRLCLVIQMSLCIFYIQLNLKMKILPKTVSMDR